MSTTQQAQADELFCPPAGTDEHVEEQALWKGHRGHVSEFWTYLLCILTCWLVLPALYGLWVVLATKMHRYELTNQRLSMKTGVLNIHTDELELYRVKDFAVERPFLLRLFGKGNVVLHTSDRTTPKLTIEAIRNAEDLLRTVRNAVEECRRLKGVREID